jgi:invasion protein IalB
VASLRASPESASRRLIDFAMRRLSLRRNSVAGTNENAGAFVTARITKSLKSASRIVALICLLSIGVGTPIAAQTPPQLPGGANSLQETFENWTVACVQQNGAKRCSMSQQQTDAQSHQRVLAIEFAAPTADQVEGTLALPFGLDLGHGVTFQIDDGAVSANQRFRTCLPVGCLIPFAFDAKTMGALRKGVNLKVAALAAADGKEANFTIALKGFPAALDRTAALAK